MVTEKSRMAQMLTKTRQTVVRCCGRASTQPFCIGEVKQHEHGCSCLARATAMGTYFKNCTYLALKSQHFVSRVQQSQCLSQCGHIASLFLSPSPQKTSPVQKKDTDGRCSCYPSEILSQVSFWCFVSITRVLEIPTEV